ncbi:MAG TPA: hypothetical protein VN696_07390 [Pyrinomonadaceae bacterium]|nr:hypothetical protein [Pyrinomonadaceae bacterium]
MRRLLVSVGSALMINLSVAAIVPAQTQADAERIAKVKRTVNKIGSDANVNIKFLDGRTAKGRITVIGDSSFVLVNKKMTDSMTIGFAQVKEVGRVGDNAFSDPAMWVGIAMIPAIIGLCLWARNKD